MVFESERTMERDYLLFGYDFVFLDRVTSTSYRFSIWGKRVERLVKKMVRLS